MNCVKFRYKYYLSNSCNKLTALNLNLSPSSQKHSAYKFHNFQRARFARSHGEKSKARGDFFLHKIRTPPRVVQPGVGDLRRAQKDIKIHAQFRSVRVRRGKKIFLSIGGQTENLAEKPTDRH